MNAQKTQQTQQVKKSKSTKVGKTSKQRRKKKKRSTTIEEAVSENIVTSPPPYVTSVDSHDDDDDNDNDDDDSTMDTTVDDDLTSTTSNDNQQQEQKKTDVKKNKATKTQTKSNAKSNAQTKARGIKKKRKAPVYVPCRLSKEKLKRIVAMIHYIDPDTANVKVKKNAEMNIEIVKQNAEIMKQNAEIVGDGKRTKKIKVRSLFTVSSKYNEELLETQHFKIGEILRLACEITESCGRKTLSSKDISKGLKIYKSFYKTNQ